MVTRSRSLTLGVVLLSFLAPMQLAIAEAADPAATGSESHEDEDEGLRQRLTEREDQRRPARPWHRDLAGRPLTISGELEVELGYLRRRFVDRTVEQADRFLLETTLEIEAFYSFGQALTLFAQMSAILEEDLFSHTPDGVSDFYVERGEMWLYSENIAGSRLNLEIGRLDFEDERRWWWDDELDAVRVAYETRTFEIALAVARELASNRSDRSWVDPEHDRVLRYIGEVSWDWSENHALELFLLHQDDRSRTERPGDVVGFSREDESDAKLTWVGARILGVFELSSLGFLGYWLDAAWVRGHERLVEFEEISPRRSRVDDVLRRDIRGWALDLGLSWILPLKLDPRVFFGYARGSGDSRPEEGDDRSFRQTGLHANEAGFGGVERFAHYGVLLDPELSNLEVWTVGVGVSLLRSSSLDLVYHRYRQVRPAPFLRDSRLEASLTGSNRDLGDALDLVLALEEWEHVEFTFVASAFRAGRAFGRERNTWSFGAALAARLVF